MSKLTGASSGIRALLFSSGAGCLLALLLALPSAFAEDGQKPPEGWPDPEQHGLLEDGSQAQADLEALPEGEAILQIVQSVEIDTPLILARKPHVFASGPEYAYHLNRSQKLVAIDLETASTALSEVISGDWDSPFFIIEKILAVRGSASDFLVATSKGDSWNPGALRAFSLAEISEPDLVGEIIGNEIIVIDLPFDDLVLIDNSRMWPGIYDLKTMTRRSQLGGARATRMAASKNAQSLIVATLGMHTSGGTYPALYLFDCSNPDHPVRLPQIQIEDSDGQLGLDPEGKWLFHSEWDSSNQLTRVRIRSARTGELQSTLEFLGANQPIVTMARGRSGAVLAVARDHAIELHDLQDPRNPTLQAIVEVDLDPSGRGWHEYWNPEPYWHASRSQARLYTLDKGAGAVVVIDVDTGVQLSRWNPESIETLNLTLAEGPDGDELCVLSHLAGNEGSSIPKAGVLHSLRVGADGSLDLRSAYDEILPEYLRWLQAIGGRYLVAYDDWDTNALISVDSSDGSVSDSVRPMFPESMGKYDLARIGASDGSLLLSSHSNRGGNGCWTLVAFDDGVFGESRSRCPDGWLQDALLGPGGIVYSLTRKGLLVSMPGGEEAFLPFDLAYFFHELELSADNRRLLLSESSYGATGKYLMIDVEDPLFPRVMHGGLEEAVGWTFRFVREGSAFLATFGSYYNYSPQLFDTESGEALGDPGEPVRQWFYHGPGIAYGHDRFAFWHWTWFWWETSVYDLSEDTPVLLGVSPFEHYRPHYAARSGTDQAYLFAHEFTWAGYPSFLPTNTMLIGAEGEFTRRNALPIGPAVALRHGFLAMTPQRSDWVSSPQTLVVLRDPELNRPPVAHAGANQLLECDDAGGAKATLDGRASSDPDSTPGTGDDIVETRWDLDGGFAGDQILQERWLAKGEHLAELTLRDKLDAQGSDEITISILDTAPPAISLELQPAITGSTWLADHWWLESHAEDLCDGELEPEHNLLLDVEFLAAESALAGGDALEIVVRQDPTGLLVELHGDPAVIGTLWLGAQQSGRLSANTDQSLHLELIPPGADGLLARYLLEESGRLVHALSVRDHLFEAAASDAEGLTGRAARSLRQRITEICEQLPENVLCAGPRSR